MKIKSLKSNILYYFILFITLPLIVSTSYIFYQMHKSQSLSIYKRHYQILKQVEQESDKIINQIEFLGNYIKNNKSDIYSVIDNVMATSENISSIVLLNSKGKVKKFSSRNNKKPNDLLDYSKMKFFKDIKNNKMQCWSDVYISKIDLLPAISYSLKIDENTILAIIINLDILNEFAKNFKSIDSISVVRIIDKNGHFLVNPDHPEFVRKRKNIKKSNLYKKYILNDYKYKQIEFFDLEKHHSIGIYGVSDKLKWYILIKESYDKLFLTFKNVLFVIGIFLIIVVMISIYFSVRLSQSILKPLDNLVENMDYMAHEKDSKIENIQKEKIRYKELDRLSSSFLIMYKKIKVREEKILLEIESNKKKDIQLFEQSKMAALGEMIGNIAHQWRQPLSIISTTATGMHMQKEMGILDDATIVKSCITIDNQAQYLSHTIDDFKNFIKNDERKVEICDLKECIEKFLHLIEPTAKNNNINIVINLEEGILYKGFKNELIQCLINLFNNAKDALDNVDDKFVFIDTYKKNKSVYISIKDNANGIPNNIINKIFEPYFTTKHKSKGTGLGLSMTYNLIVDGMKGNIEVSNVHYDYKDKNYKGALFIIILPLNI